MISSEPGWLCRAWPWPGGTVTTAAEKFRAPFACGPSVTDSWPQSNP